MTTTLETTPAPETSTERSATADAERSGSRHSAAAGQPYAVQCAALVPGVQGYDQQRASLAPDAVAASGLQGGGAPLPHLDRIQQSFGHHDVSGVRHHSDGAASNAAQQLGARAFAMGNAVGSDGDMDLHTAAHEAAHVVQQRGGVQLKGGMGEVGDRYERHADAVADKVVGGESAEALLDTMAASPTGISASGQVQRKPSEDKAGSEPSLDDQTVNPEDTDSKEAKPTDTKELAEGYAIGFSHDIPVGAPIAGPYATVTPSIGLGVKGAFKPKDEAWLPGVGWEGGVKAELLSKEWTVDKAATGFGVEKVELKGAAATPLGKEDDDKNKGWLNLSAELKVIRANGSFHAVGLTMVQVFQKPDGSFDWKGPGVEVSPIGLDVQTRPVPIANPEGVVEGEFSVSSKIAVEPNWPAIIAKATGKAAAANSTIALNSISLLEMAALAAPVAFAGVTIMAAMDLDDAISRKDSLGADFRAALAAYRSGMQAGLTGGDAGAGPAARGFSEGKLRNQAGYVAFKKKASAWVAAQQAEGRSDSEIDAELRSTYDSKLAEVAGQVVQRATAQFDGQLRREMLQAYLNDHGGEWGGKPGLVYNVFKQLYPQADSAPWTVPEDLYNRVKDAVKSRIRMQPWRPKPKGAKPKPNAENPDGTKTISGLDVAMTQWCRAWIYDTGRFFASEVAAAYEAAHPGHVLDATAMATIENLCDEAIKDPMAGMGSRGNKKDAPKEPEEEAPTAEDLDRARKVLWQTRVQAEKLRNQKGRSQPGEGHWRKAEGLRGQFVSSNDIFVCDQATGAYHMAIEAWGGAS